MIYEYLNWKLFHKLVWLCFLFFQLSGSKSFFMFWRTSRPWFCSIRKLHPQYSWKAKWRGSNVGGGVFFLYQPLNFYSLNWTLAWARDELAKQKTLREIVSVYSAQSPLYISCVDFSSWTGSAFYHIKPTKYVAEFINQHPDMVLSSSHLCVSDNTCWVHPNSPAVPLYILLVTLSPASP